MNKPILLLDVDGVLLHQFSTHRSESTKHGWIDPQMKTELLKLEQEYQIVWCTGWGHSALTEIAPLFGCDEYPVLPLTFPADWIPRPQYVLGSNDDSMNKASNWKLPAVEHWLERFDPYHPVTWVDDEIGQTDVKRWAQERPNTMLVHVRRDRGVARDDLKRLHEFAYLHKPRTTGSLRDRLSHVRRAG